MASNNPTTLATRFVNCSAFNNTLHGTITRYSELADGSALIEEFLPHQTAVSKLIYSEKFEAGSENAADCIKVARKNSGWHMIYC
jgi:hypothetical protein